VKQKKGDTLMLMIPENFWNEIKKVIPGKKATGRPPCDAKYVLSGIFYTITTGSQWRCLPDYYGKPSTVHGRFMTWINDGIFEKILEISVKIAIEHLGEPESFFCDTSSVKSPLALFGGRNPTDRGKHGVKKGIIIDMNQIILSLLVDSANKHDSKLLMPHIKNIEKFVNKPKVLTTDSAWDVKKLRKELAKKNLALHASTNKRRDKNKKKIVTSGRWKIEQIFGRQQWYRGIKCCWAKTQDSFLAFCQFVSAIHNFKLVGVFG
jgi:putative transposase